MHDIQHDMISYSWVYSTLDFLFTMYVNVQDLDNFKSLLVNDGLEEAQRILANNSNEFRKEVKSPSALKDLPRDDFAMCLITEDINQARGQRLFALKAMPNGVGLFNAVSILLCENESVKKSEVVKAEALVACTRGKWSSFMHVLGLASVVSKPLRSIYPDVNFRFRSLIHRSVSPRTSPTVVQPCGNVEALNILWSRDGNFDNRPGA